jgi:hypothetical protein
VLSILSGISGNTFTPMISVLIAGDSISINFGQQPFAYTPPSGFVALNTYQPIRNKKMPTTYAIPDGRTVMAATLYTGTGAGLTISNAVKWSFISTRFGVD